jgi:hypothetical protein
VNPAIGKEPVLEVAGKKYKLARFDRAILGQFLQWAKGKIPHPLAAIKDVLPYLTPEDRKFAIGKAMDDAKAYLSFDSEEVRALLASAEGSMKLLCLLFQKHHPDLTDKDVENLYEKAQEEHGVGYFEGKIAEAQGEIPVPKSEAQKKALEDLGVLKPEKKKG